MADLQLLHLVARTASGARPFHERIACADLWNRIMRSFDVVACVLMPDHVHLLAHIEPDIALRTFARVLSAFRLRMQATMHPDLAFDWERLPQPEKVQNDRRHIARTLRYIHLNPTRDALCNDPLEWEWSTHRDWVGAVAHPGVDRARWARAMRRRLPSCIEWLHEYVTSDASVRMAGPLADCTPWLRACEKDASLEAIASAVPRVLRSARSAPYEFGPAERRLFLLSAARWTRYRAPELARYVGCHPSNALRMVRCEEAVIVVGCEGAAIDRIAHREVAIEGSAERASMARRSSRAEAARKSRARRAVASGAETRVRRSPLTADELQAMALTLADRRLSAMPLCPDAAEPADRRSRGRTASSCVMGSPGVPQRSHEAPRTIVAASPDDSAA